MRDVGVAISAMIKLEKSPFVVALLLAEIGRRRRGGDVAYASVWPRGR